jgi:hypothetical protein
MCKCSNTEYRRITIRIKGWLTSLNIQRSRDNWTGRPDHERRLLRRTILSSHTTDKRVSRGFPRNTHVTAVWPPRLPDLRWLSSMDTDHPEHATPIATCTYRGTPHSKTITKPLGEYYPEHTRDGICPCHDPHISEHCPADKPILIAPLEIYESLPGTQSNL